jgi:hypothetical protein
MNENAKQGDSIMLLTQTPLREVRKLVAKKLAATGLADSVRVRTQDGAVLVRRSYFYRNGNSELAFAAAVASALGDGFTVTGEDHFHNWPKVSFFQAVVRVRV